MRSTINNTKIYKKLPEGRAMLVKGSYDFTPNRIPLDLLKGEYTVLSEHKAPPANSSFAQLCELEIGHITNGVGSRADRIKFDKNFLP